ncbi:DUF4386 domain-containing protein [Paracrocinitomix mangrovi]|uniref:DUF4386 domain-containing protein n=1 Tax=Paracrocinitomix mangrovi TaxID=2862509 RepID=UPI001C8E6268|nr:DUF4386 domain-containing protein [Paracrocinitomix mangrovi]UKN00459.1 DUF4386 domain-containing protein [Paracrocinitomix mangrovi]
MRKTAILGGIGYLIIFITGIFANFYVLEDLKMAGDPSATYQNLSSHVPLVMAAVLAFIFMVVFDIVLTWVLYVLFKNVDARLSKITALFRLINALIFGAALIQLVHMLELITTNNVVNSLLVKEVSNSLNNFNNVWLIGLVFFGIHLILLSILLKKSRQIYPAIPSLLFIAGVGYIVDTILQFTYPGYANLADISALIVVLPGLIGELSLTAWLLFKAEKTRKGRCELKYGLQL